MITYTVQNKAGGKIGSRIKSIRFPGGEVGVKLQQPVTDACKAIIRARITSSDEVIELLMVVDAMRRQNPTIELFLDMPYTPYARQDRVCDQGESLSIAVFAKLINSCCFKTVRIYDPHSDVTAALIKNCVVVDQVKIFRGVKQCWGDTIIVAPDAGAYKKAFKFAKEVGAKDVLSFNKVRDMATGAILRIEALSEVDNTANYFVLDDIGDGMRTFIELAHQLADVEKLDLAVTHGIFSKGVECFRELYDEVYTTNSFHGDREGVIDGIKYLPI